MYKTEISLTDGNKYYYTISTFNVENALGIVKATLKEFTLYRTDDIGVIVCKLYKTDEGNWYDLPANNLNNPLLLTSIKMAIDKVMQTNLIA
ncbi:MAG: hypothetical protein JO072_16535 [Parafilimonas sp.]|nr:hypothetical protein [Parafilimonas sp.]